MGGDSATVLLAAEAFQHAAFWAGHVTAGRFEPTYGSCRD